MPSLRISLATMVLSAAVVASAHEPRSAPLHIEQVMSPEQALELLHLKENSGRGINGVFEFEVRSTGGEFNTYLNSHEDYRDPANLAVRMGPEVSQLLKKQWGDVPRDFLKGKRIAVEGTLFTGTLGSAVSQRPLTVRRMDVVSPGGADKSRVPPRAVTTVSHSAHAWIELKDPSKIRIVE